MPDKLVSINPDSVRIGQPLPFSLKDSEGTLLAQKGFVVQSRAELEELLGRGFSLYIDAEDSEAYQKAFVGKLYSLVSEDKSLGQIAGTRVSDADPEGPRLNPLDRQPDWLDLQHQANSLLRDAQASDFLPRLEGLHQQLRALSVRNPDGCLFALYHLSTSDMHMYSATHAMLVSTMCQVAAREVLNWSEQDEQTLSYAALTMNLGMTELQDRLAQQASPLTASQAELVKQHPAKSAELLLKIGVTNTNWLEAVRLHHAIPPGAPDDHNLGQRMARLIQRADMFSACQAPRASRAPSTPAAAIQVCYFDDKRRIDEAGAAMIKAVGIYAPGSFVRLNTNEIAVVVRRGATTTGPRVAVMVNREGIATAEPLLRDTTQREFRIVASVPHREIKVKLSLARILPLTTGRAADWVR